jgi:hypothetical protein
VRVAKAQAIAAIGFRWPVVAADVTLHFRPSTKHRRDADGMYPTLKVCQDALVLQGVLPDDSWVHVPAATYRIHPPNGEPAAMWLELSNVTHYDQEPTCPRAL